MGLHTNGNAYENYFRRKVLIYRACSSELRLFGDGSKTPIESENGKFQTEIRDNVIVILNTQNGDYLFAADLIDIRRNNWVKGEFYKSFSTAKDSNKSNSSLLNYAGDIVFPGIINSII